MPAAIASMGVRPKVSWMLSESEQKMSAAPQAFAPVVRLAPVENDRPHGRAERGAGVGERGADMVVRRPAALDEDDTAAGGEPLEREVHRRRIGLGVKGQAADEEHDEVVGRDRELAPRLAAVVGRYGLRVAVDAERDDRQPRQARSAALPAVRAASPSRPRACAERRRPPPARCTPRHPRAASASSASGSRCP